MKRRISIAIGLALLLTMALFSVASAHAKLVYSDPAAGAKLAQAPAKITLVFDEEISAKETESFFNVTNEAGTTVGSGKLDSNDLDHKTLSGTLNSSLGDGVYTVKWQTTTTDDNGKSEGSFAFGVNKDSSAQPTAAATPTTAARPTATPAAVGATQPTAAPAAGGAPTTLPNTGEPAPNWAGYFMLGAVLLMIAGAALLHLRKRA